LAIEAVYELGEAAVGGDPLRNYRRAATKAEEMEFNFDLAIIVRDFGIADLFSSVR
jgi:hypothetical protein